jgi:hypothetical protein
LSVFEDRGYSNISSAVPDLDKEKPFQFPTFMTGGRYFIFKEKLCLH